MSAFAELHFLRPWGLLALLPAVMLTWALWRRQGDVAWRRLIPPHLLPHLLSGNSETANPLRPLHLLALFWFVGSLAFAGPSWQREASPFADDQAPLVIALHVGESMLAQDIQPTRLERATHKIRDLLALRPGVRVALIAYAGSAHLVIPFTTDTSLVETFAAELSPEIMPVGGNSAAAAVEMGRRLLVEAGSGGSVLLITDHVDSNALADIEDGLPVDILAIVAPVGTPAPLDGPPAIAMDEESLSSAASILGGRLEQISVDNSDVRGLSRRLDARPIAATADEGQRWRDAGYYLLFPIALLVLLWFRQGWAIRW
jgi:Ca-activated chloride channel family protein